METPRQLYIPAVKVDSEIDEMLLVSRIKEVGHRMAELLEGEDPEIIEIAQALIEIHDFNITNSKLNEAYSRLTAESEALIDSPDANTPEIKLQREIIAGNINKILDKQHKLEYSRTDIRAAENIIKKASKDQLKNAELLIKPISKELNFIANPASGSN